MSDFRAKMYQIQFRLGLRPRPHWGSLYSATPDPRGPTSKGRGRIGRRKGRERERKPRGGEGTRPTPSRSP